jgi:hypothetical protein
MARWGRAVRISVNLIFSSVEAVAGVSQTVQAFQTAVSALDIGLAPFGQIDHLAFHLAVSHPAMALPSARASGSYAAATRTFYAKAGLNYLAWVGADWRRRVEAVGHALTLAAAAIHKTRISEAERAQVLALIAQVERETVADAPAPLLALQPVELTYYAGRSEPYVNCAGAGFQAPGVERAVTLAPEDIEAHLRSFPADPALSRPEMFKRYRRSGGVIDYHEAWPADGAVIEHWGVCGERGETREHPAPAAADQRKVLGELKAKAAALGFKAVPISRHAQLVVGRPIAGMGTPQALEERHALEAFLDEQTGWLGLGHCDGGSIGSGSMEAFCFVVDAPIARAALTRVLAASPFSGFTVRV